MAKSYQKSFLDGQLRFQKVVKLKNQTEIFIGVFPTEKSKILIFSLRHPTAKSFRKTYLDDQLRLRKLVTL